MAEICMRPRLMSYTLLASQNIYMYTCKRTMYAIKKIVENQGPISPYSFTSAFISCLVLVQQPKKILANKTTVFWLRSRASECQCKRHSPGFDPSLLRHIIEPEGRRMKQCRVQYRKVGQSCCKNCCTDDVSFEGVPYYQLWVTGPVKKSAARQKAPWVSSTCFISQCAH